MAKLINHRNGPTSLGACKDVLDRAGLKPDGPNGWVDADGQPVLPVINVQFVSANGATSAEVKALDAPHNTIDTELPDDAT